jgi:hypothetical protein
MNEETRHAVLEDLVTLVTNDQKAKIEEEENAALKAEQILVEWFSGGGPSTTPHGLSFDCDQADLDLFIAYMKTLPLDALPSTLASLLKSRYVQKLPRQRVNCLPKIHFRAISSPYQPAYQQLVREHKLSKFVPQNCTTGFMADAMENGANRDVYLCFIQFGEVFVVNMLPAVGLRQ